MNTHSSIWKAVLTVLVMIMVVSMVLPVSAAWVPVSITDATGTEITINEQPERIVSLSPTVAEILFAIGAGNQVVATTTATNYPEAASKLPTIGDYSNLNNEAIISYSPKLIIGEESMVKDETVNYLRNHGCIVLVLNPTTIESTLSSIITVGKATGHQQEAESIVSNLEGELSEILEKTQNIPDNEKPRVAHLNWYNPLSISGSNTFQDAIINAAGCKNAFSDVEGWGNVNIERFLVVNPDIIVITTNMGEGTTEEEVIQQYFGNDTRLQKLSAYKNNKIIVIDADLMDRSGPRFIQAVKRIGEKAYLDTSISISSEKTAKSPGFLLLIAVMGLISAFICLTRRN